jgi:hypothetical protein
MSRFSSCGTVLKPGSLLRWGRGGGERSTNEEKSRRELGTHLDSQPCGYHLEWSHHKNGGEDDKGDVRDQRECADVCKRVVPLCPVCFVAVAAVAAVRGDARHQAREEQAAHGALDDDEPEDVDRPRGD